MRNKRTIIVGGFLFLFLFLFDKSYIKVSGIALLVGLPVGRFLNILTYNLPRVLEIQWLASSEKKDSKSKISIPDKFSQHPFICSVYYSCRIFLNHIIIFMSPCSDDFFSDCGSILYRNHLIFELLTAAIFGLTVWFVGHSLLLYAYFIFFSALLMLAVIDLENLFLPDVITQPLVWIGLFVNLFSLITSLPSAVLGAMLGYLSLYFIAFIYQLICHRDGIGSGDFKFLSGIGAWLGWRCIPVIIFLSAFISSLVCFFLVLRGRAKWDSPQPFGPYLAFSAYFLIISKWLSFFTCI